MRYGSKAEVLLSPRPRSLVGRSRLFLRAFLPPDGAVGKSRPGKLFSSWPGIAVRRTASLPLAIAVRRTASLPLATAVRRTASLPLAYVPAIHVFLARLSRGTTAKTWMPGTSSAKTREACHRARRRRDPVAE